MKSIIDWILFAVLLALISAVVIVIADNMYMEESGTPFVVAALISQVVLFWLSLQSRLVRGVRGVGLLFFWPILYILFFSYMDHPWFAGPDPRNCDGPCYGWYGFENDGLFTYPPLIFASSFVGFMLSIAPVVLLGAGRRLKGYWNGDDLDLEEEHEQEDAATRAAIEMLKSQEK